MTKVKKPPVDNGIDELPDDFIRQLREFNGLKDDEEIIYTFKMGYGAAAQYRNPAWRFLFTESYFVVPEYNMMLMPTKGKKYLWSDFVNIKIEQTTSKFANAGLTFAGKKVHIIYYPDTIYTKSRVDKWRFFYLDLQKYLRDNAHRIH